MWPTPFLYKKFVEVYHNQESEDLQQLNVHYPTKFDIVCNHAIYTPSLEKLLNLENRNEFHFTIDQMSNICCELVPLCEVQIKFQGLNSQYLKIVEVKIKFYC